MSNMHLKILGALVQNLEGEVIGFVDSVSVNDDGVFINIYEIEGEIIDDPDGGEPMPKPKSSEPTKFIPREIFDKKEAS